MQTYRGVKSNPFSSEERQAIAERLGIVRRSMRQGKGMLQSEMAELVDVSHSHYSKCESGHNSFSSRFLERFSERTGISLQWLLHGAGEMYPRVRELREESLGWQGGARPPGVSVRPAEEMIRKILEASHDPQVVAAAEALAQATGSSYDESAAMVIARRLAVLE